MRALLGFFGRTLGPSISALNPPEIGTDGTGGPLVGLTGEEGEGSLRIGRRGRRERGGFDPRVSFLGTRSEGEGKRGR